jgi:hypothetical protein
MVRLPPPGGAAGLKKAVLFEKRTKKLLDTRPEAMTPARSRFKKVFCCFFSKKQALLTSFPNLDF